MLIRRMVNGSRRRISFGGVDVQVSELAKLAKLAASSPREHLIIV